MDVWLAVDYLLSILVGTIYAQLILLEKKYRFIEHRADAKVLSILSKWRQNPDLINLFNSKSQIYQ